MSYTEPMPGSLKRKRRRPEGICLSARLQLSDTLTGQFAEVSLDIAKGLRLTDPATGDGLFHLAVRERSPTASSSPWTILPCKLAKKDASTTNSSIRVSTRSRLIQPLAQLLKLDATYRPFGPGPAVDVHITDAVPLPLDTIYVSLDEARPPSPDVGRRIPSFSTRDRNLPQKPVNTNGTLGSVVSIEDMRPSVRKALTRSNVIHTGDILPISHPKLSVPPELSPLATITACEPVAQGIIAESTRIVITSSTMASNAHTKQLPTIVAPSEAVAKPLAGVEEDSANEAFHSAVEDANSSSASAKKLSPEDSDAEEDSDGNLSDDPEDMISLTSPALGSHNPGMLSSLTAATPRAFGRVATGIHTPGSVFSNMTSATLRGQPLRSKVLRTQGLYERVPDSALFPKPLPHEDEEARVYVETSVLARLGCFSGDWVEINKASDPALSGIASLGMSSFLDQHDDGVEDTRAAKIFGLPESLSTKSSSKHPMPGRKRSESFSSVMAPPSTPTVYLSPILLANVGTPGFLRLTPMRTAEDPLPGRAPAKMPPTSLPPAAREANLLKIQSPVSTDKAIDSSIFSGLVNYFERKQRLVKTGDLIAIPLDESVGRALYDGSSAAENGASNDLLKFFSPSESVLDNKSTSTRVVWFQVGSVSSPNDADEATPDVWNGLVSMVPSRTKLHQSGTLQRRVPPSVSSTWPFYKGVLAPPLPSYREKLSGMQPTASPSNLHRRLTELVSTATSAQAIQLGLPPLAILLHSTQRGIGKSHTAASVCTDLGLHCFPIDAYDILTEAASGGGDNNTVGLFDSRAERALQCGAEHTCLLLQHLENLGSDRMYSAIKEKLDESRILVATTTDLDKVPENLRGLFTHELEMSAPDEAEREAILQSVVSSLSIPVSPAVDLAAVAVKTAALVAGDLVDVVDRAIAAQATRLEALAEKASETSSLPVTTRDIRLSGGEAALSLLPADFDAAVDEARKNFADAIGAPKIPNVQWSDVGGLANVKEAVIETIQLPLSRPELFAKGLKKRSGILFYGPPGTGKTLLAKAIATEFSLNFFSVKGPELLNMYIGESEANVRRVFQRARDARPCVVFFDELDSVAPKRGNQGDSGGVMDRIVSQLLAELDGMSDGDGEDGGGGAGVFVIGATNRPDLLDQALLRPGRFDKMLYLGISDTHDKQQKILEALTRKFALHPSLNLGSIAKQLPFTYTGADLYALCSDAMLKAVTRSARAVDDRIAKINAARASSDPLKAPITIAQFFDHHAVDADLDVLVMEADFLQANAELVPSVSAEELGHYERVRKDFEGDRTKPKDQAPATNGLPAPKKGVPTQAELEAWQAAKIEELMRNGFSDGSLARNDPRDGSGKGKGKARQAPNGTAPATEDMVDGSGEELRPPSSRGTDTSAEDMVVRTGQLDLDGNSGGSGKNRESRFFGGSRDKSKPRRGLSIFSHGKGKGSVSSGAARTGSAEDEGFGDAARDQGLYE